MSFLQHLLSWFTVYFKNVSCLKGNKSVDLNLKMNSNLSKSSEKYCKNRPKKHANKTIPSRIIRRSTIVRNQNSYMNPPKWEQRALILHFKYLFLICCLTLMIR